MASNRDVPVEDIPLDRSGKAGSNDIGRTRASGSMTPVEQFGLEENHSTPPPSYNAAMADQNNSGQKYEPAILEVTAVNGIPDKGEHSVNLENGTVATEGGEGKEDDDKKDEDEVKAVKMVSFSQLFRFSDCKDLLLLFGGLLAARPRISFSSHDNSVW